MILYNITYSVPHAIENEWVNWQKNEHIPEILATGLFERHLLLRLKEIDETDGATYALQLYAASEDLYRRYLAEYAPALRLKANAHWGDEVIGFRTLMEIVH
jgi:Domain of unknown function (DUF4286)